MGTPAAIGIVSPDGTVRACYIHYDGYLLDGVGEELLRHHDRYALAARLVASGDRSSLDPVGMGKVHQYQSVAAYLSLAPGKQVCDYGYLFERGCWSAWAVELTGPQPDLPAPLRFKLSERLPLRTALVREQLARQAERLLNADRQSGPRLAKLTAWLAQLDQNDRAHLQAGLGDLVHYLGSECATTVTRLLSTLPTSPPPVVSPLPVGAAGMDVSQHHYTSLPDFLNELAEAGLIIPTWQTEVADRSDEAELSSILEAVFAPPRHFGTDGWHQLVGEYQVGSHIAVESYFSSTYQLGPLTGSAYGCTRQDGPICTGFRLKYEPMPTAIQEGVTG